MEFSFSASGSLNDVREQLNAKVHDPALSSDDQTVVRNVAHHAAKFILDPAEAKLKDTRDRIARDHKDKGTPVGDAQKDVDSAPQPQVSLSITVSITGTVS
jgi:hypothetical protein